MDTFELSQVLVRPLPALPDLQHLRDIVLELQNISRLPRVLQEMEENQRKWLKTIQSTTQLRDHPACVLGPFQPVSRPSPPRSRLGAPVAPVPTPQKGKPGRPPERRFTRESLSELILKAGIALVQEDKEPFQHFLAPRLNMAVQTLQKHLYKHGLSYVLLRWQIKEEALQRSRHPS